MKALFDINVWIDIAVRPKAYPDSVALFRRLESDAHHIGFPLSGYTTFYYLIAKIVGKEGALLFCRSLIQRGIRLLPLTNAEVEVAHSLVFRDHEDACVSATALAHKYDLIVTRNGRDYKNSPVVTRTPAALLRALL